MLRCRNLMLLAVAALMLGSTGSAKAAFEIYLKEDAGAWTLVASAADFAVGGASYSGTFGDFDVTIFGSSSKNTATKSSLLSSTTQVVNNDGVNGHILYLMASQQNYTLPSAAKLNVESALGGSVNGGTVGLTGIFQAYADKNNGIGDPGGTGDFTNGAQNASQTGSSFDTGSKTGVFSRDPGNYSLTSIVKFDMGADADANFADHVNVTPAPAPMGLLLVLSALPVVGGYARMRRRSVAEVAC